MPPRNKNKIPLQIVFQGGGAKICALMAVCDVLKEYEAAEYIAVKRVGGSSAGAIAAVMYASKAPINDFVNRLKLIAPGHLSNMDAYKVAGYSRIAMGKPFVGKFKLEDFFKDLFCWDNDLPKQLGQLRMDTEIYSTNMYQLSSVPSTPTDAIPEALANSCRIPYFFSGYMSDNKLVDGGLALNLPAERFKRDESTLGKVLGISFGSSFGKTSFASVLDYTGQLFSAAIQSNVDRSVELLGKSNVFFTATSIDTFDFKSAMKEGFEDKFKLVRLQFQSWLDNKLEELAPEPTAPGSPFVYPLVTNSPWPAPLIEEMKDRYRAEKFTHAVSIASYDTAILDSDGKFAGRYRSRFRSRYKVLKKTHSLAYDFQSGKSGTTFADLKLKIMVNDEKANPLKFTAHVQELPPEDDLRSFRMFLLFDTALLPEAAGQPFTVICDYEVDDPFPKLGKEAEVLSLTRADGDADEVIVAAAFPREKLRRNFEVADLAALDAQRRQTAGFKPDTQLVASEQLEPGDIVTDMSLTTETAHYIFEVRRAKDMKQGQTIGFLIE